MVALVEIVLLVFCFFVFNVTVFVVWDLYRKRHIFKFARELNGYTFYPIIGNGHYFIGENILSCIRKVAKKYSLPCNIWIGHDYNYVTTNAGEIKILLNHPNTFDKSALYESIRRGFGKTLLMAEVGEWKRNRKIFARSFSQPMLNGFVDIFYKKSCTLIDILRDCQPRDKYQLFDRFSLDNFCANIMRLDLDAQVSINDEMTDLVCRLQDTIGRRMVSCYLLPESLWKYTPTGRKALDDYSKLQEIIYGIIQKKRKVFLKSGDRERDDKLPLMDMMLDSEGVIFSDEEIFNEIFLFLLAATDTSGVTLAFTFTLLGMNPEAQEKVYQEVIEQIGLDNPIVYSDLPNLKYTEKAIFESMRLLPVVPVLGRRATADVDIGTRTLPAGSNIVISIFNLHRSEDYWEDPLRYNPDRFSPEEVAKRDAYTFIPFSSGPRNCIGMKYALMMMKTAVANVIRSFHVKSNYRSVEDMNLESCVTMKTVHELDCKFIPRNR